MAVDGEIKEKKKKKKIKEEEVEETAKEGGTKNKSKYQHASVQTTEQSWGNICEEEQHEYDAPEKKKKKKIKEEKVEANDLFALCCDASVQTAVKTEQLEIDISEGGQEKSDLPQKEKKKKRKIKKESEHLQENVIEISEAEEKMDEECLVKKKKRKKKETKVKEEEIDVGHYEKIDKKKKKKRKNMEDEEQNPESEDGEVKKTRKKTEANVKEEREEKQTEKKKKKKEKNTNLKTENNEARVKGDKEKKVKTKKEKSAPIEEEMSVNTEKKSKKKKKRLENLDEGQRMQDDRTKAKTGDVIGEMMSSKHKMKKNIKLEVDDVTEMEEELHDKKTKHDKNKSREKSDVVFLSSKSGNQDEISIDQARRLALQKEIDKESQPKPNLGQWSTAQFDSSDRQTKFMRLMGGFKKSSQPITGSSGQANMALGREAQQTLQQGLLGEFESTRSRHLDFRNKGIGLGFTPPSNKKFAIDVNARNSMRFDD